MQRHLDLNLGIWADPIYFGDYPASVKAALGSLLPSFTPEQSAQLVGSATYFGERRLKQNHCASWPGLYSLLLYAAALLQSSQTQACRCIDH